MILGDKSRSLKTVIDAFKALLDKLTVISAVKILKKCKLNLCLELVLFTSYLQVGIVS